MRGTASMRGAASIVILAFTAMSSIGCGVTSISAGPTTPAATSTTNAARSSTSGGDASEPDRTRSTTTTRSTSGGFGVVRTSDPRRLCEVVPVAAMEALVGATVTDTVPHTSTVVTDYVAMDAPGDYATMGCMFDFGDDNRVLVGVVQYARSGRPITEATFHDIEHLRSVEAPSAVDEHPFVKTPGVGDQAFFDSSMFVDRLIFLVDGKVFAVEASSDDGQIDRKTVIRVARSVADT